MNTAEQFQLLITADALREVANELQRIIQFAAEAEAALQRVIDLQAQL